MPEVTTLKTTLAPALTVWEAGCVVNVGAIGRPAHDGRTNVWYAELTFDAGRVAVGFRPVAYDHEALAREMEAEGLGAICVQHEMDHLIGRVFVEYLSPLKRDRIRIKMQKKTRDEMARSR